MKIAYSMLVILCLVAGLMIIPHGERPSFAAAPVPPTPVQPMIIANDEWTFNLNNVCTSGPISIYHVLGNKDPMMLSLAGLEATMEKLVQGGTWIKTGMPKYINLNTVGSAQLTKANPPELEIIFSDGAKEQLTGDDVKTFRDATARLLMPK